MDILTDTKLLDISCFVFKGLAFSIIIWFADKKKYTKNKL